MERVSVDVEDDARTIGRRLRLIRNSRKKGLRVIAGLAGMSKSHLSEIERGESALDSISEIVALANALGIAPSELMRLPVPAPANGETDSAVEAVRSAVTAASPSFEVCFVTEHPQFPSRWCSCGRSSRHRRENAHP